jgi:hypothetical protein
MIGQGKPREPMIYSVVKGATALPSGAAWWRFVARVSWMIGLKRAYGFAHVRAIEAHCRSCAR